MLAEGLNLALFGMGTVFSFLGVLILVTGWMSSLVRVWERKYPPAVAVQPTRRVAAPSTHADTQDAERLKKILKAAIVEYRKTH